MQLTRHPGTLLLSLWLIAIGVLPLLSLHFPASGTLLALLAIAAGVLLLVGPVRQTGRIGPLLLSIWLVATGVLPLVSVSFPASEVILALLAIAAGVLLLLGR
jgi:hypothetical protein